MSLHVHEFLRRLLLDVLPKGFVRIRHFGFLSTAIVPRFSRCAFDYSEQQRQSQSERQPPTARSELLGRVSIHRDDAGSRTVHRLATSLSRST
jgi:hypothetical protein